MRRYRGLEFGWQNKKMNKTINKRLLFCAAEKRAGERLSLDLAAEESPPSRTLATLVDGGATVTGGARGGRVKTGFQDPRGIYYDFYYACISFVYDARVDSERSCISRARATTIKTVRRRVKRNRVKTNRTDGRVLVLRPRRLRRERSGVFKGPRVAVVLCVADRNRPPNACAREKHFYSHIIRKKHERAKN